MILGSTYLRHHCAKCRRTLTDCLVGTKNIYSVDVDFERSPDDVCRSFKLGQHTVVLCKGCAIFFEQALDAMYSQFLENQFGRDWDRTRGRGGSSGTSATPSQAREFEPDPNAAKTPEKG